MNLKRQGSESSDQQSDKSDTNVRRSGRQARPKSLEFAERLKHLASTKFPTGGQAQLAREIGVGKQSIGDWLKGSMPAADVIFRLSDVLGVDPRWLATGFGQPRPSDDEPEESDWVKLPRLDLFDFRDGQRPEPIEQVPIRRSWLAAAARSSAPMWLADLPSDAMPDVGREGDTIVCRDPDIPLADGRVYVLLLDDRPIVRRVQVRPDGLMLKASDASIDPVTIPPDRLDELVPVGRVVAALTMHAV